MATNYPESLDSLTNPSPEDSTATVSHASQHASANDAIEALQAKVGIDSSAVPSSIDYQLTHKPITFSKVVAPSGTTTHADYYCDGTNDDVQIQAAIDAVGAAGGGTVFLRAGTYVIGTPIDLDSDHTIIFGESMTSTVIKAKDSMTAEVDLISIASIGAGVERLTVDGNKANNAGEFSGIGFYSNGENYARNVLIKDMSATSWGAIYISNAYVHIHGCYIQDCEGIGIESDSVTTISNCFIIGNSLDGIYLDAGGTVIGCNISGNGHHGINITTGSRAIVSNNRIYATAGSSYPAADNTYSGIYLASTATRNVISNNIIKGDGTNDYQYGIREASSSDDYNVITNNIVTDCQTGQISTQGSNTITTGGNITS